MRCKEICGTKTDLLGDFYQHRLILPANTLGLREHTRARHHYNYSTNKEQCYVMNSERFTTARSSRTRCSRLVVVHRGNSQPITFHHLVRKSNSLQQVDQTNEHITFDWFYGLPSLQKAEDCRESWTVEVYRDLTPRRAKSLRSGDCWERCFVRLHAPHLANRSLPRSLSV